MNNPFVNLLIVNTSCISLKLASRIRAIRRSAKNASETADGSY